MSFFVEVDDKSTVSQINIINVEPNTGVVNTTVRISGQNFYGVDSVIFSDNVTGNFTVVNKNLILATIPNNAAYGSISVGSQSRSTTGTYSYFTPFPNITGFNPITGTSGDLISIYGNAFSGITGVKLNNLDLKSFAVANNSTITGQIDSGNTKGLLTVYGQNGTFDESSKEFTPQPILTSVTPTSGLSGIAVEISGLNFFSTNLVETSNGSSQYKIGFGNIQNTGGFEIVDQYTLTGFVPNSAQSGYLYVYSATSINKSSVIFNTVNDAPSLINWFPSSGASGDFVSISGANIFNINSVTFSGDTLNPVTDFTYDTGNGKYIHFNAPSLNQGLYDIIVSGRDGDGRIIDGFTVLGTGSISGFEPITGAQNSIITISGENLYTFSEVYLNNRSGVANIISGLDNHTLYVRLPDLGTTGSNFIINNSVNTVTGDQFRYYLTPRITGFDPTSGSQGDSIIISGDRFDGVTGLQLGTKYISSYNIVDQTGINFSLPYDFFDGPFKVIATGGNSISRNYFNFLVDQPTISGFTPTTGYGGVTELLISGISLKNTHNVQFSGVGSTTKTSFSFLQSGNNFIFITVPSGTVDGQIIIEDSENRTVQSSDTLTIATIQAPFISGIDPLEGPSGSTFIISGSGINNLTGLYLNSGLIDFTIGNRGGVPVASGTVPDINPMRQEMVLTAYTYAGSHSPSSRFLVYSNNVHLYDRTTFIGTGFNHPDSGYQLFLEKQNQNSGLFKMIDPRGSGIIVSSLITTF